MNLLRKNLLFLAVGVFVGLTSCGSISEEPKGKQPESLESVKPWNIPQEGEYQGGFGAFGAR